MIATALNMDLHAPGTGQMDHTADSVLEILVRLFYRNMWQMVKRGFVRRYLGQSENLPVLRGRLSVARQIRSNLARPDRLACDFDEFSENNLVNQVLKGALRVLLPVVRTPATSETWRNSYSFSGGGRHAARRSTVACRFHRPVHPPLEPLLDMARIFIEGRSQDVLSGANSGYTLLFDMNELFEAYVGAVARKVFSSASTRVTLQGPVQHLARRPDGGPAFQLKPDIIVADSGQVRFIADTKWKRLKPADFRDGVASSDVYQMYAYSSRYRAPEVVLLYPHHAELGEWKARRAEYRVEGVTTGSTSPRVIGVSTIDLRDLATVPTQLAEAFASKLQLA